MGWLVADNTVRYMDAEHIKLGQEIPVGVYKYCFHKLMGSFLDKTDINLAHGKIYGNSENIANHIVKAYELNDKNKNLGVLMSGGKGLGKSLTAKLVIQQLKDKYPIIVVDEYTADLPDFLGHVSNCIIMLDEFEKVVPSENSDQESGPTGQESLLSVLDGTSGSKGNLFVLTVNNTFKIDENMKSRPGRIRYHYQFKTADMQTILNYCEDNLNAKDKAEELANSLMATRFVSMDIITAVVDEMNKFPELSIDDILEYMNIENSETEVLVTVVVQNEKGEVVSFEEKATYRPGRQSEFWVYRFDKDEDESEYLCFVRVNWSGVKKIPYIGNADISKACRLTNDHASGGTWKIVKALVESPLEKTV